MELYKEDGSQWATLQKSHGQLRSKRYHLKLTEIMPVPFGSNTIKDVPEIVFSQETEPFEGFTDEVKENETEVSVENLENQRRARAKLIADLENELSKERKGGGLLKRNIQSKMLSFRILFQVKFLFQTNHQFYQK